MTNSGRLQSIIHLLEEGAGSRVVRTITVIVAVIATAVFYDVHAYKNFATQEAMDSAQVARNLADGKGFTTLFIRPFSIYLVQKHNAIMQPDLFSGTNADLPRLENGHPDLANPPVYPLALAGLMKVLPFQWPVETKEPFWTEGGRFSRYEPDFLIAIFNQLLLVLASVMTFYLARKLFDVTVAWLSATIVFACALLWQFSVSGLSTMLLLVIFLGLMRCVLKIEEEARVPQPRTDWLLWLSAAAGAITATGMLTRYAFGWLIIPVVIFLALFGGSRRSMQVALAGGAFVVVLAPWIMRNWMVSGTLFGTAGYSVMEGTFVLPGLRLEQSLHPDLTTSLWITPYTHKLLQNLRIIFEDELPKLGGSWAGMLFLTGLLLGLRGAAAKRARGFLLMCLGTFIFVQAMGRTQLSEDSPVINSENQLVILVPVIFIYAIVFFLFFLGQMKTLSAEIRFGIVGLFVVVMCLPLIATLLSPRISPVAFPPYYPPEIQQTAGWMKKDELIMSDVPAAVAWYGHRQCLWLTLDAHNDFFTVNDYLKPISALYLSRRTVDGRLLTDCVYTDENSWGRFAHRALLPNQLPQGFPLRHAPYGLVSGLFFTDRERWEVAAPAASQ